MALPDIDHELRGAGENLVGFDADIRNVLFQLEDDWHRRRIPQVESDGLQPSLLDCASRVLIFSQEKEQYSGCLKQEHFFFSDATTYYNVIG